MEAIKRIYRFKLIFPIGAVLGSILGALPIIIEQRFMKLGFLIGIIYLFIWFGWFFLTIVALTMRVALTDHGIKTHSFFSFLDENIAWTDIYEVRLEWPLEQLLFYSKRWKKDRIMGLNALNSRLKDDIIDELYKRKLVHSDGKE